MATDRPGAEHKGGLAGNVLATLIREATRMPLIALSFGIKAWEQGRPVRELVLRRGNEALQIAAHTPLGRLLPQPVIDDDADVEAERIAADARVAHATATARAGARPRPGPSAAAMGAPGVVSDVVEKISDQLQIAQPVSADDLAIPDFDNVSIGSLRARLRSLSIEDLVTLREWEKAHAHRLPVITLLDNRIAKVSAT